MLLEENVLQQPIKLKIFQRSMIATLAKGFEERCLLIDGDCLRLLSLVAMGETRW